MTQSRFNVMRAVVDACVEPLLTTVLMSPPQLEALQEARRCSNKQRLHRLDTFGWNPVAL